MKLHRLLPLLFLIMLWQGLCYFGIVSEVKVPSPVQVVEGFIALCLTGMPPGHLLLPHVLASVVRVSWGYGLAVIIAIPLGLLMGWSGKIRYFFDIPLEILRPIPPLAWIPISILWLGIGTPSAAFIIFLGAFFPILLNTVSGVRTIDPILVEAATTLNAGKFAIFFKVLMPATVPAMFTGMRIGIGIAWMTLVAAEFTGVREGYGLGYMIMTARDIQRPDIILAGMLVIGFIGLAVDAGLRGLENKLVRWK